MDITIADGTKMKTDTLFVECTENSLDVESLVWSALVPNVKGQKKCIQFGKIAEDLETQDGMNKR